MRSFTTKLALAAALLVLSMQWLPRAVTASGPSDTDHGKTVSGTLPEKITYSCPMHPEVKSDKPGKCPKCGMFLEAGPVERTVYLCPMCPDVKEGQPGKCPKCGMNLEKRTEKVAYTYTCPMHPDVTSDKPGKCPKCGMFLEAHPDQPASVKTAGTAAKGAG